MTHVKRKASSEVFINPKKCKAISNTSGFGTLESSSARIADLFTLLKTCMEVENFNHYLQELFELLIHLRKQRCLPLNFPIGAIPNKSINTENYDEKKIIAETEWIVSTCSSLCTFLKERIIHGSHKDITNLCCDYLMNLLKVETEIRLLQTPAKKGFPLYLMDDIMNCILMANDTIFPDLLEHLRDTYLLHYRDLQLYIPISSQKFIVNKLRHEVINTLLQRNLSFKIYSLLQCYPTPKESTTDFKNILNWTTEGVTRKHSDNIHAYKDIYSLCWTTYLLLDKYQLCLTRHIYKEILITLPTRVLPFLKHPLVVSSFFLTAFDEGSIDIAIQALSGLFYLLMKHNLGDPELISKTGQNYFNRLLDLIQPDLFLNSNPRFLRLLRISLQSKLLPTSMVACFIKKLICVALLTTSPGSSAWLLALALKLLQRSGLSVAPLLYNRMTLKDLEHDDPLAPIDYSNGKQSTNDKWMVPYEHRIDGLNPIIEKEFRDIEKEESQHETITNNNTSRDEHLKRMSLWELEVLKKHWCASVREVAQLFNAEVFKPTALQIDPDDLAALNMQDLLLLELKTMIRQAKHPTVMRPLLDYDTKSNSTNPLLYDQQDSSKLEEQILFKYATNFSKASYGRSNSKETSNQIE